MKTKEEKIKESKRKYREKNREKLKQKSTEYYSKNKERYKENRETQKEKIKEYRVNYYAKNKDVIIKKTGEYAIKNKEKVAVNRKQWKKLKLETDPLYKLSDNISKKIRKLFKRTGYIKNKNKEEILGCTMLEFKKYLESKFEYWMSWENRGLYNGESKYGWDIDHVIPISSANDESDIIRLNHYTNLQPLCSYINRCIKKDNTNYY